MVSAQGVSSPLPYHLKQYGNHAIQAKIVRHQASQTAEDGVSLRAQHRCVAQGSTAIELGRGKEGAEEVSNWATSNLWKQIKVIPANAVDLEETAGTA